MTILVINPGSTSTKVSVYEDDEPILVRSIRHTVEELAQFSKITQQLEFRRRLVEDEIREAGLPLKFDAVIGRGGLLKPIPGGVYLVNEEMCHETYTAPRQHACNLGCIIAYMIAKEAGCPAYIADPGVVDELEDEARVCGSPLMHRICIWHALNQKAIARRYARSIGRRYEDLNLIVCHLGGGISIAAHRKGRAIDANNALDGEGPFSPERAGTLPAADLVRLCFSGKYTEAQLLKRIAGSAGLAAHLGTTDILEITRLLREGDAKAKLLIDAMIYHTAKCIASEGAVLRGHVDAILLTGGIAHSDYITSGIRSRVDYLAPVHIFPGENEMEALALNALAVLRGEREAQIYK